MSSDGRLIQPFIHTVTTTTHKAACDSCGREIKVSNATPGRIFQISGQEVEADNIQGTVAIELLLDEEVQKYRCQNWYVGSLIFAKNRANVVSATLRTT